MVRRRDDSKWNMFSEDNGNRGRSSSPETTPEFGVGDNPFGGNWWEGDVVLGCPDSNAENYVSGAVGCVMPGDTSCCEYIGETSIEQQENQWGNDYGSGPGSYYDPNEPGSHWEEWMGGD